MSSRKDIGVYTPTGGNDMWLVSHRAQLFCIQSLMMPTETRFLNDQNLPN
jgi:hypothetical protein